MLNKFYNILFDFGIRTVSVRHVVPVFGFFLFNSAVVKYRTIGFDVLFKMCIYTDIRYSKIYSNYSPPEGYLNF